MVLVGQVHIVQSKFNRNWEWPRQELYCSMKRSVSLGLHQVSADRFPTGFRRTQHLQYKNTKVLVNIMPELLKIFPNSHLQIVGDGEDLVNIKSAITLGNLGKSVELTGKITDEELRLRYSSCDIYISASEFEVCPVPTLEAMACGVPVVCMEDSPKNREYVEESGFGKVVYPNKEEIKRAVEEIKNEVEITHTYYNSENCSYSQRQVDFWEEFTKESLDENLNKISDDELSYQSEFPHGF